MAGTKEGAAKAKITNMERHGKDFFSKIGRKGGQNGTTGGFASNVIGKDGLTGYERARIAGQKGGKISKRNYKIKTDEDVFAKLRKELGIKDAKEDILQD